MAKKFQTLNIGAATVELAEYETGAKGTLTLVGYGTAKLATPLDPANVGTVLPQALLEIVREKGIRPGRVSVSIPGQMVFPRLAAIAAAGGDEKFDQMVRFEIEQNIPFPIDEMVCDRQIVGETAGGDKSVLIVAAKIDQTEALTNAIASVGFSPELVDVAPLCLVNVLQHAHPESGCAVLLDIGARTTSLAIVEDGRLYNRSIPVAGSAITKEIAQALGCEAAEAERMKLERGYVSMGGVTEDEDETVDRVSKACRAVLMRLNAEITRSINFYRSQQGGSMPTKLYLTGGTALLPQIDQFFADSLGIEVEFLNPFEAIRVGSRVDAGALEADGALIAVTAGLALHAAGLAKFAINLLPPALVEDRAERARIPFLAAAGVFAALGLVFVMLGIDNDTAVISAQRDAVQGRVGVLRNFDRKVKSEKDALTAAEAKAGALRDLLTRRASAVQQLNAVRGSLLPGMWIEKWGGGRVVVRYWADGVKAAGGKTLGEVVVEKLKAKAVVDRDSVKIADMSTVGKNDQVRQFTVELKFR